MKSSKSPNQSAIEMRQMVMPGDTNIHGTIFGGKIMAWVDIAGAMVASKHCGSTVVTANISDIDFFSPISVGHHVIIKASINYAGKSSMIIGVRVESENPYTGEIKKTTKAYLTFVAVDAKGKSIEVPKVEPITEIEKRRYANAKKRKEAKISLNKTLSND